MATWNTVNFSYLLDKNRIDSEFYKKEDVDLEDFMLSICNSKKLKNETSEIKERFTKTMSNTIQYNDIGNTDIYYGLIKENIINSSDAPGRATYINLKDDVLISSVRPNRNANAIVNENNILQVGSNGFCNLRSNGIDPNYIFIFSKTKYFIQMLMRATTSSMYPSVSNRDILNTPFFIPNEQEVKNISSNVITARELQKKAQEYYEKAAELLNKELNLDDIQDNKYNFSNKYLSSFEEVVNNHRLDSEYYTPKTKAILNKVQSMRHTIISNNFDITNGFPWNSKKFLEDNSGEPVIRIRDVKPTYIDKNKLTSLEKSYANTISFNKAQKDDIVIGMDGVKYFYASILEEECLVNQRVCHIVPKANSEISSEYTTFIINSIIGQSQLLRDMTIASTVGHITNKNVAKLKIPVVSDEFHNTITSLIRKSIDADKKSKILLEQAKQRVEELIENAAGEY
jgi:type I restriction enzyme, S subunit